MEENSSNSTTENFRKGCFPKFVFDNKLADRMGTEKYVFCLLCEEQPRFTVKSKQKSSFYGLKCHFSEFHPDRFEAFEKSKRNNKYENFSTEKLVMTLVSSNIISLNTVDNEIFRALINKTPDPNVGTRNNILSKIEKEYETKREQV